MGLHGPYAAPSALLVGLLALRRPETRSEGCEAAPYGLKRASGVYRGCLAGDRP